MSRRVMSKDPKQLPVPDPAEVTNEQGDTNFKNCMSIIKIVPKYDGTYEFSEWLERLRITAKLRGVTNLSTVLPLLLEGNAFKVYQNMSLKSRDEEVLLIKALHDAFSIDSYTAYCLFVNCKYTHQGVDVFAIELTRLAKIAGIYSEQILINAFLKGNPGYIYHILFAPLHPLTLCL